MAAAVGKKESVSLSLFMEVNTLEVEVDFVHHGSALLAEGVWMGRWKREQQTTWKKQNLQTGERACTRIVIWASSCQSGTP